MLISFSIILFLFIRIFSNPIANLFQKKLSDVNSSITINFYSFLLLSIFVLPFVGKFFVQDYTFYFWFIVFISGFLCTLGTLFLIKAMQIGELSVIAPINSYKSIVGLVTAFFLLNEIPSFWGIIGMILIIYGSKFIFVSSNEGFSFSLFYRKDIQFRLLALLCTGIEAAFLKQIIILSSVEVCFILWCFGGALWSMLLLLLQKKKMSLDCKKSYVYTAFIACALGLMQYSTNFVFNNMHVGYALALFQLSSVVSVFLGCKVLNEQNLKEKLIGTFIMIIGSCLIILK